MGYFDESKINKAMIDEQKNIDGIFYQIGKSYYSKHSEDPDPEFAGLVAAVKASADNILAYRNQIRTIRGLIECPSCHSEVSILSPFCNQCGQKLPVPEGKKRCFGCGALNEEATNFCTSCGKPFQTSQPAPAPAADTQTAFVPPAAAFPAQPIVEETPAQPIVEEAPAQSIVEEAPAQPIVEETPAQPEPAPAGKVCAKCGNIVPDGFAFCTECGTPVNAPAPAQPEPAPAPAGKVCAKCGNIVPDGFAFCTQCGTPVNAPVQPAPASPAERRCPNCGNTVPAGFAFCTNCGMKL